MKLEDDFVDKLHLLGIKALIWLHKKVGGNKNELIRRALEHEKCKEHRDEMIEIVDSIYDKGKRKA